MKKYFNIIYYSEGGKIENIKTLIDFGDGVVEKFVYSELEELKNNSIAIITFKIQTKGNLTQIEVVRNGLKPELKKAKEEIDRLLSEFDKISAEFNESLTENDSDEEM